MCQHDFDGERIFQHRNRAKWGLWRLNPRVNGFWHEEECLHAVDDLRRRWNGKIQATSVMAEHNKAEDSEMISAGAGVHE